MALVVLSCAPIAFPASLSAATSNTPPKSFRSRYAASWLVDRGFVPTAANKSPRVIDLRSGWLISKDIDGDGDLDLICIVANEQSSAAVLINDGAGDFTKSKDNTPYAAALEALLSSDDPSEQPSLQAESHTYSLLSSSFHDIGPAVISSFACPSIRSGPFTGFDTTPYQATFLSDLRKRGPPLIFS